VGVGSFTKQHNNIVDNIEADDDKLRIRKNINAKAA
jgi:hypothetical protein